VARARPALGCRVVDDLVSGAPAPRSTCRPQDLALVQFSSGTTRAPRPVALTHASLTAQCEAMRPLLRARDGAGQRGVSWLPLYHDMGLIGALLGAVTLPGPLTLIPPERFLAQPALWLQTISREKATISPAPPFAFALCTRRVRDEEMEGCDLSSWRLAICGAEPIQPSVLERFSARFAPWGFRTRAMAPAYGLAEASLAVTCTAPDEDPSFQAVDPGHLGVGEAIRPGPRLVTAVGETLAGTRLEIRDGAGRPLPDGHCGHIWACGPTVMREYLGQPAATAEVLRDGWLDTGDLGFVLAERLHVIGRTKDVVVVRGANHRAEEFEACLLDLEGVRPGRVVAGGFMPPDADGEELLLLIERSPHARDVADADLVRAVNRRIRVCTGVRPGRVVLLQPGTLLRTSSGKLRRGASVRKYLDGTLTPPGAVHGAALTRHLLRSAVGFLRARLRP
jgi:acyl-CoA synthetase (AMP-forming)/AMP-acid ligase II